MTLRSIATGSALALAAAAAMLVPARAVLLIQSTFDENLDGWGVTGDATTPVWKTGAGGTDGGYIEASDRGDGVYWYWSAPAKFLGDRSTAYGQNLKFRLWESNSGAPGAAGVPDVVLKGDRTTLVYTLPSFPLNTWTEFTVPLVETAGWELGGDGLEKGPPDTATMHKVLTNLDSLEIRGEYISGPDTGRLDSVTMELSELPPARFLPVVSTFDSGDEGWTVYGDAQGGSSKPTHRTSGGVGTAPSPYVEATDNVQGGVWYWNAPGQFLGNLSDALGRSLTFYLRQSSLANQFTAPDVILEGGGHRLVYMERSHPGTDWTRYIVPLRAQAGWHLNTADGPTPTTDTFRETLSLLQVLRIRGEYITGPDTDGMDMVVLGAPALITGDIDADAQISPTDAIHCLRIAGGLISASRLEVITGDVAPASAGNFGDGRLDVLDAIRIIRRSAGMEPQWP